MEPVEFPCFGGKHQSTSAGRSVGPSRQPSKPQSTTTRKHGAGLRDPKTRKWRIFWGPVWPEKGQVRWKGAASFYESSAFFGRG